jgi:hypothetical protein
VGFLSTNKVFDASPQGLAGTHFGEHNDHVE